MLDEKNIEKEQFMDNDKEWEQPSFSTIQKEENVFKLA